MHPAVRFTVLFFWASLLCLPEAAAVERKPSSPPRQEELSAVDASFVLQVVRINWAELDLAELALQKARNPEVRRWAEAVLASQKQATKEVMRVAQEHNLSLPAELDPEDRAIYFRLKGLSPGKLFDMSYLAVSTEHRSTMLKRYGLTAKYADSADLRLWAKKELKAQRQQLWQSRKMMVLLSQDRLKGPVILSRRQR